MRRSIALGTVLITGAIACTNAGENLTVPSLQNGAIAVSFYLDRNGSHLPDAGDTAYGGVRVALLVPSGSDTLQVATANGDGVATFDSVPIGTYRIAVDRAALADTIGVAVGDTGTIRLIGSNTDSLHATRVVRLGYTEVSAAAARRLPAGKRVLIHGTVVSPFQAFRDSSAFIVDTSGSLRITSAIGQPGHPGNNIGDSVVVLGTTGESLGEGVLDKGLFTTITGGVAPIPVPVGISDVNDARSGALDAVLVQLTNVQITDTATVSPDFTITVKDPADTTGATATILVDQLLNPPHNIFLPGRTGNFRGVLVPKGDGTWVLKPRSGADLVLN